MHVNPQRCSRPLLIGLLGAISVASLRAPQPTGDFEVLWEFDAKG